MKEQISKRQKTVLKAVIKEYVKRARPISSQFLEQRYSLGVSPATIRNEMQKLTEKGFLLQPHTSAGRVPSDKGYRFFINELLDIKQKEINFKDLLKMARKKEASDMIKILQELSKGIADFSRSLVISYWEEEGFLWKEGWEKVLKEPEFFENKKIITHFTQLVEVLEKNINQLPGDSEIKVFIGRENPFCRIEEFSIISSGCSVFSKQEVSFCLLGPKRMAYDRNIGIINSLKKILQER